MTSNFEPDSLATGGEELLSFARYLLDQQESRRTSLDQRASTVLAASSALAGVLIVLTATLTREAVSEGALWPITISIVLLIGAAALALTAQKPKGYETVRTAFLKEFVEKKYWLKQVDDVRRLITDAQIGQLVTARDANRTKATLLKCAVLTEVGGVLALLGLLVRLR